MENISETLAEREARYGSFAKVAEVSQELKAVLIEGCVCEGMEAYMLESLDMICNKIARIVAGDPTYSDSWHDIAGYATLVVRELENPGLFTTEGTEGE